MKYETTNNKYNTIKKIGEGTYGEVLHVSTSKKHQNYALKMSRKKEIYKSKNVKETFILKRLKHNNIIKVIDTINDSENYGIILPLYKMNLYQYIRKQIYINHHDTCIILSKISSGLDYLKRNSIIHRDLKPENILLNSLNDIVISDFGISIEKKNLVYDDSPYQVQTIFYRAPEIYLESPYNESIDMWSLGCIAYEIYWKRPLFTKKKPSELFIEQNVILKPPSYDFLVMYPVINIMYDDIEDPSYMILNGTKIPLLSNYLNNAYNKNMYITDFVKKCCTWKPSERITPYESIKYLKNVQKKS